MIPPEFFELPQTSFDERMIGDLPVLEYFTELKASFGNSFERIR
jgi:hypothetical protein